MVDKSILQTYALVYFILFHVYLSYKPTLSWIFRKWDLGAWTRIELTQDRDRWQALLTVVMNLQVPLNVGTQITKDNKQVTYETNSHKTKNSVLK